MRSMRKRSSILLIYHLFLKKEKTKCTDTVTYGYGAGCGCAAPVAPVGGYCVGTGIIAIAGLDSDCLRGYFLIICSSKVMDS